VTLSWILNTSVANGDGIVVGWLGHGVFRDKEGHELFVRRMPTFFETFPVVLVVYHNEITPQSSIQSR